MSEINTGGPAFPIPLNPGQSWQAMAPCDGMTLRDYFASKAMQTIVGSKTAVSLLDGGYMATAISSYAMADAMLKARQQ